MSDSTSDSDEFFDAIEQLPREQFLLLSNTTIATTTATAKVASVSSLQLSNSSASSASNTALSHSSPEPLQSLPPNNTSNRQTLLEFLQSTSSLHDALLEQTEPEIVASSATAAKRMTTFLEFLQLETDTENTPETDAPIGTLFEALKSTAPPIESADSFERPVGQSTNPIADAIAERTGVDPNRSLFPGQKEAPYCDDDEDNDDLDSMVSGMTTTTATVGALSQETASTAPARFSRTASLLSQRTSFSEIENETLTAIARLKAARRFKNVPVKTKSKTRQEFGSLFLIQELNRPAASRLEGGSISRSVSMSTTSPGLSTILEQSHELESGNEQAPGSTLSPSAQSPQQGRSFGRSRSSSSSIDASKAIFALKFSPNGRYLATAGAEGVIKIWRLIAPGILDSDSTLDRDTFGRRGSGTSASKLRSSVQLKEPPRVAAIFEPEPVQILKGHSGEILDLTWSANDFLLSASMDRTVRLWHYSRSEALGIFQHLDYVTSVAFHPRDPRLFVSGSLDCRLRLWSIQERTVQAWNELPPGNFITAAAFTRTGKTVVAGTSSGIALLFEAQSLKYHTQILVRSSNRSSGKKITGIEPVVGHQDDERILVSSNDSRIRMYSLRDKNVLYKYKGHSNVSSQIGASLSSDGDYVLGGSEDCRVYIWNVDGKNQKRGFFSSFRKDHISAHESFKAHSSPITAATFAPAAVQNLLKSAQLRPLDTMQTESLAEGQIIVTADITGQIKVFENNSQLKEWLDPVISGNTI